MQKGIGLIGIHGILHHYGLSIRREHALRVQHLRPAAKAQLLLFLRRGLAHRAGPQAVRRVHAALFTRLLKAQHLSLIHI